MKSPILNLILLVLEISLNLSPNTCHKGCGFSEILLKKSFEFISSKEIGTVIFNLGLVLLPVKVDPILEE